MTPQPSTPEPALALNGLTLTFGSFTAVDTVSLEVARSEIFALLGPSGSGKSSILRLVAGLDRPTSGRVAVNGIDVAGPGTFVPPEQRPVGMVFQDYALFPHLTVHENVAFGLRGEARATRRDTVARLLDHVGLSSRAASYPHMLSGGERQRVALARALAPKPDVLLMDEPFSGLDGRLRDQVRDDTVRILRETQTTAVIVTHDPAEGLRVASRIGVLDRGRLVETGSAADVYCRPASLAAARAFGHVNTFPGDIVDGALVTPVGRFTAPVDCAAVLAGLRPEHVRLCVTPNGQPCRITARRFTGDSTEYIVRVDSHPDAIVSRVPGHPRFDDDDQVWIEAAASDLLLFPMEKTG